MPAEPRLARRGDIAYVNLLKQELMPVVGRVEYAQRLFISTSCGRLITERVMRAAERECREGKRRVCIESLAEGGGRAGGSPASRTTSP